MQFGSNFVDILLWTLWIWLVFAFFMVLFRVFGDLFSDKSVSGMGKFWWSVFIIFLPFLGLLVYLIARGNGMAERQATKMAEMQAAQAAYIRQAAGTGSSPTDQIASAKGLLDSGTITQAEFDALKSKALAG
jgi:phosphoglycerol transferase MdoB-like AlkP superfamily enzyme